MHQVPSHCDAYTQVDSDSDNSDSGNSENEEGSSEEGSDGEASDDSDSDLDANHSLADSAPAPVAAPIAAPIAAPVVAPITAPMVAPIAAPVVAAPIIAAPGVAAPIITAPVVASPVEPAPPSLVGARGVSIGTKKSYLSALAVFNIKEKDVTNLTQLRGGCAEGAGRSPLRVRGTRWCGYAWACIFPVARQQQHQGGRHAAGVQ